MPETLFPASELPTAIEIARAQENKLPAIPPVKRLNPQAKLAIPLTGDRNKDKPAKPQRPVRAPLAPKATAKENAEADALAGPTKDAAGLDSTVVRDRPDGSGWDVYIDVPEGYKKSYSSSTTSTKSATTPAADSPSGSKYIGSTYTSPYSGTGWKGSTYSGSSYTYSGKWTSAGIVVFAGSGLDLKVLVCKPKNGYGSNKYTLPKGKIETAKKETSYQAAVREVQEETNVTAEILPDSYLGLYEGSSSLTHYYTGVYQEGDPGSSKEMEWAGFLHVADALNLLRENPRDKQAVYLAYKRYSTAK